MKVLPFIVLTLFVTVAHADIIQLGGDAVYRDPPPDIRLGRWASNTEARVWSETTRRLSTELALDSVATGTFDDASDLVPGRLASGTWISSYAIRTDAVTSNTFYSGYVIFDSDILGVLIGGGTLNATDSLLGRPGVQYDQDIERGVDFAQADNFVISSNRRRIDFLFQTLRHTDTIRVITAAVPAPGALALVLAVPLRRRRR